jgi:hypothetical protein
MSAKMVLRLSGEATNIEALAESVGASVTDVRFRRALWQAMQAYREETGIQLVEDKGEVVPCDPMRQVKVARAKYKTSAIRARRAGEVATAVLSRGDEEAAKKAERLLHAQSARGAATDGASARMVAAARRDDAVNAALAKRT